MNSIGWIQFAVYLVALVAITKPMGLYLMQVLERPPEVPGGPVLAAGNDGSAGVPPVVARASSPSLDRPGNGRPRHIATSVDDLEEAFQRKKRRELEQARMAGGGEQKTVQQVVRGAAKVGRNELCPCGSGKKYKKCHGA